MTYYNLTDEQKTALKAGSPGGKWACHGKTPAAAVKKAIAVAKAELADLGASIQGL